MKNLEELLTERVEISAKESKEGLSEIDLAEFSYPSFEEGLSGLNIPDRQKQLLYRLLEFLPATFYGLEFSLERITIDFSGAYPSIRKLSLTSYEER